MEHSLELEIYSNVLDSNPLSDIARLFEIFNRSIASSSWSEKEASESGTA